ncbi:Acetylajmalan esterase [Sesamum angolense]|uniref:Acetylajmalan esterase n=1 Tax=Sesamum angolense TaxID=2727404 RepID=A0AAE1W785_9LAMI|nr:Acetylajmalan esterase [Sesamum angolense]
MSLGLPLLNPYLDKTASFNNGVNFAVASATTLDPSFYLVRGIIVPPLPSLRPQLSWFKTYLTSECSTPADCADKLKGSLFFVGEFGYNDIYAPYGQGRSIQRDPDFCTFSESTHYQFHQRVDPTWCFPSCSSGKLSLGCFPTFLAVARKNSSTTYDDFGCVKSVNDLTSSETNDLQGALNSLRNEFPDTVILYADYYNAFLSLLRQATTFGFDTEKLFIPCCGDDGVYNVLLPTFCGGLGVPVCPNPNVRIHWDGIHLTQEAYRRMSDIIIGNLGINCTQ